METASGWYLRLESQDAKTNRHRHYTESGDPKLLHPEVALVHL